MTRTVETRRDTADTVEAASAAGGVNSPDPVHGAARKRRHRTQRRRRYARGVIGENARHTLGGRISMTLVGLVLGLMAVLSLFPFYWLGTASFKRPLEIVRFPPTWWPQNPSWHSYSQAWQSLQFARYFTNSAIIAAGAVILRVVVCLLAAYSLSRLKPPCPRLFTFSVTLVLMVPAITYFVPQFVTVTHVPVLGVSLVNTWWAIWLPGISSPVVILLFKQFFDQLPGELFEAAELDGAGSLRVLVQIVVPLARPVIGVAAIYTFISIWQDFLWPLLTLPDDRRWPLEVAIYKLQAGSVPLNVQMAGMVIATIPMVVICMIFQRQIITSISMSEGK